MADHKKDYLDLHHDSTTHLNRHSTSTNSTTTPIYSFQHSSVPYTPFAIAPMAQTAPQPQRQQGWSRKACDTSSGPASRAPSTSSQSDTSPRHTSNPSPSRQAILGRKSSADGKPARKKVAKACLACQKSHLTCDECRPCTRCMKKGIGDQCVEGVRKKAKYLMEGDEREAARAAPAPAPAPTSTAVSNTTFPTSPPTLPFGATIPVSLLPGVTAPGVGGVAPHQVAPQAAAASGVVPPVTANVDNIWLTAPLPEVQAAPALDWSLGTNDQFNFSSSAAANLEYEMFDSMFGSMSPSFPLGDLGGNSTDGSTPSLWSNFGLGEPNSNSAGSTSTDGGNGVILTPQGDSTLAQPDIASELSPSNPLYSNGGSTSWGNPGTVFDDPTLVSSPTSSGLPPAPKKLTPADVYNNVLKPYDYTEGYHILMAYLTENFEKQDILRVVRALAAFRPSLIALQMPMSEEDEVFLERSFQRTLIELEKLISYSATPTAVWRRTGEIVCAAPEFCQLVGKTEEQLVRSKTCIYQLFSKSSTIDYWENFAEHAFENTTQNFFQATSLEGASKGTLVPCAACYTIRRDVFDLPSVVIGQFLPIPQEAM